MKKTMLVTLALVGILGILAPSILSDAAWKSDSKGRRYTTKSAKEYVTGWKKIGSYRYYFNNDKYAATGWKYIAKKWYYFDVKGRMLKNIWVDGYYLQQNGAVAINKVINGTRVGSNGQIVTEETSDAKSDDTAVTVKKNYWECLDDKWFYYNYKGNLVKGWLTIKEDTYYMDPSTGERLSGVLKIDKKYYYLDPDTGLRKTGWQTYNNKKYYFSKDKYYAVTKWNKIRKKLYYFNKKGVLLTSRWIDKNYYVDKKGRRSYGWVTLDNTKYYFDTKTGIKATKWNTISKKIYYFKADGSMVKNKWVSRRYLQDDGTMATNKWVGGYYVGKNGYKTGQTRTIGFYTTGGKTYYYDSNYNKVKGWLIDKNKSYYFNKKGVLVKNSWVDGYYVGSDGVRLENQFYTIKKKIYLFLADGTKAIGSVTFQDKDYYFNANGVMKTGFIKIEGIEYYFDPATGAKMKSNVLVLDDKTYYFDYNGYSKDISDMTLGEQMGFYAQTFVGNPYKEGGTSLTNGADCSGFVQSIHSAYGISIPRVAADQATGVSNYGGGPYAKPKEVSIKKLLPGDLIFYYNPINHVAMYIGNGLVVHASTYATGIKISAYDYATIVKCVRYW